MKKKKKACPEELRTTVDLPLYQYKVHIIFSNDVVKSRSKRDKFFKRVYDMGAASALHCTIEGDEGNSYIFFPYDVGMSQLVHEASHAIETLILVNGMRPCKETRGYLYGYLCSKITLFMHKTDIKYVLDREYGS